MLYLMIIMVVVFSAIIGLIVKIILDKSNSRYEITWKEYLITMVVISFLAAPGVIKIGWEFAKSNKMTYREYWNGWEERAIKRCIECERDGSCEHCYDCDPYIVMVNYPCNCDDKGNCSTCTRPETHYHSCPYVDMETDYVVKTTLGDYTIASNRFPDNPQQHRWRKSESIPQGVINRAGVGAPSFWTEAKSRIEEKVPGPVTKRMNYKNYIYASDNTILKQYSGEVKKFLDLNLFPKIQSGVFQFYHANKVHFVGFKPKDASGWQKKLEYFNAALGSKLQGDLYLVIIQNALISKNPDEYAIALKAYWQNIEQFGKNAFSKNGIAILLGTADGETVSWARAFTGMPLGNEELAVAVMGNLKGAVLDSENLLGDIQRFSSKRGNKGKLEDIIFGLTEESTKFRRISMSAQDKDDVGLGFLYLMSEIRPTDTQQIILVIIALLLCGSGWTVSVFVGVRNFRRRYKQQY